MVGDEFLHFGNEGYVYDLYKKYKSGHNDIPTEWIRFFQGMELGENNENFNPNQEIDSQKIIGYFQRNGHLYANTDSMIPHHKFNIDKILSDLSISSKDLKREISCAKYNFQNKPLSEYIEFLKSKYCSGIGYEFYHIEDQKRRNWWTDKINNKPLPDKDQLVAALKEVGKAKILEKFLHKKFLGAKRFSVEGGESVLALIHSIITNASLYEYEECYLAMAHRGRVNTLCHVMEKPYQEMFSEFTVERFPQKEGLGDVKYHNGYSKRVKTDSGREIFLQMAPNPSHLEAVDPVILGMVKARIDDGADKSMPIVVHGDAAVAGQGIVYETMQFAKIDGYSCGGTIHIVIDNHIGFTALPKESRSTRYPTDIAKAFSVPILHVDAGNIDDVLSVAKMAVEYRNEFASDIYINYNCHRLYGHNEADEPSFTNPSLYKKIRSKTDLYSSLKEDFLSRNLIDQDEVTTFEEGIKLKLNDAMDHLDQGGDKPHEELLSFDNRIEEGGEAYSNVNSAISKNTYQKVQNAICSIPSEFNLHPKIKKIIDNRDNALKKSNEYFLDWGTAEMMAYGSLLVDKKSIRLSGQDSKRGTFSHRHSIYVDQEVDDVTFNPFDQIKKSGFKVFNSPLSEYGVMGFEYGYSIKSKETLVIWEAQFGDFFNGASIIIDQYISSTRSKWGDDSSLVLYLPHGMEGMGSEHSSGRIERFLQLAGRNSMRIYYPSTPGQIFHLIRAQSLSPDRIPLVVFTPKSLLRNPSSKASELIDGNLSPVIVRGNGGEKKIVFCSGKIAFEIEKADANNTCAVIRIEQLYPFPSKSVTEALKPFSEAKKFIYAQEEPKNQGAYLFVRDYLDEIIGKKGLLEYVGRKRLESTATGYASVHKYNQQRIINRVIEQ